MQQHRLKTLPDILKSEEKIDYNSYLSGEVVLQVLQKDPELVCWFNVPSLKNIKKHYNLYVQSKGVRLQETKKYALETRLIPGKTNETVLNVFLEEFQAITSPQLVDLSLLSNQSVIKSEYPVVKIGIDTGKTFEIRLRHLDKDENRTLDLLSVKEQRLVNTYPYSLWF